MAVTVTGKNYTQISNCDTGTSGGAWSGSPTTDADNYKEGSGSISDILKSSGANDWTFTPTASVDLSGTKHLRIWLLATHGGKIELSTYSGADGSGGLQFFVSDGTNTGYWNMGGRDTYAGGWTNLVQNMADPVAAGIKPTAMNAITSIGVRIVLTGTAKNADNTWVDNLCVADGLIAYGDDAGGYFDFDDIYAGDAATTLGIGVVRKIGGQYFSTGSLEIGDSTASSTNITKFQAKSQVLVFENRPVDSNLYNLTAVDGGGTGTTEFILGSKSGTAGIEGCVVRVAETTQTPKYDIDGSTDADITDFKLYGSTFLDADSISLPPDATNIEVLNCNFESCGEVLADTCDVTNCNFVSANDRGVNMSSTSHNITYSNFISCAHGINIPSAGTYDFSNLVFTSCTYDIENSGTSAAVTVNATGTSNPSTYENTAGGTTTIVLSPVTTQITVKDLSTGLIIENARVLVWATDGSNYFYQASVSITGSGTTATVSHTSHGLSTNDYVMIEGVTNDDTYNGVYQVTVSDVNTYTYTTSSSVVSSPATGTIISTFAFISDLTNASGIISDTRSLAADQNIAGWVRKSSSSPYYQQGSISGTVSSSGGLSVTIQLARDE